MVDNLLQYPREEATCRCFKKDSEKQPAAKRQRTSGPDLCEPLGVAESVAGTTSPPGLPTTSPDSSEVPELSDLNMPTATETFDWQSSWLQVSDLNMPTATEPFDWQQNYNPPLSDAIAPTSVEN